jgi:hypothetical protein
MRPPPSLLAFFLEAKEDSWTILKVFFQRDGENAKIQVVGVVEQEPRDEQPSELYT